ncbi:MAG: ABC transporter ATP-binding protein [Pseudomonadota bacterium]
MLKFEQVSHDYGGQPALRDVSFAAEAGSITCLIGPSGCGKTTLLRLAAGLMPLQAGEISLHGEVLSRPARQVSPEARPVGLVFQEGALFPHLTVARNVGFGLSGEQPERVETLLADVGLAGLGERYPHTLSGGQRQRVALARALAPQPQALLFDEPYANLDIHRRRQLREQARLLIRDSQAVGVFVTHDPEEVMALADQVVVLNLGQVVQQGSPRELYDAPATLAVARLFGQAQSFVGELSGPTLRTPFGVWPRACLENGDLPDGPLELVVRPDCLAVSAAEQGLTVTEIRTADSDDMLLVAESDSNKKLYVRQARPHRFHVHAAVTVLPQNSSVFAAVPAS